MIRLPRYGSSDPDGRKSETFDYPHESTMRGGDELPAYETNPPHAESAPLMTNPDHYD